MHLPNRPYTMPELADMMKWPRRKLVRHLLRMHRERDNRLLVNTNTEKNPRWTVTLEALHGAAESWFSDRETIESRLEELESAREAGDALASAQTNKIASLTTDVKRLKATVQVMTSSLQAIVAQR